MTTQAISPDERERIELENRALLEQDLFGKHLVFASRPYEAHVQYSNFCNMSCIMCWNGKNPPLRRMAPELIEKLGEQIATWLSVITPYGGSEPLAITWDETRDMCRRYSNELCLTTNVQFLDEERFLELKDITETLYLSIDSHVPEIYARIRPGSRPDKVFANLETSARLSERHGVECIVQIVFMTENAPMLAETVAYMADIGIASVNVIKLLDVNGESGFSDPLLHFSAAYVEEIKRRCIAVAEQKRIRFMWSVGIEERYDYRDHRIGPRPRKARNDKWDYRMRRFFPGYCRNVYNRLRVLADGDIAPCCYATDGELSLGNLAEHGFDDIWNGPNAQDLRRAMQTWDYPSLCASCYFTDKLPAQETLAFGDYLQARLKKPVRGEERTLELRAPEHMTRAEEPPAIELARPDIGAEEYTLCLSVGGELDGALTWPLVQLDADGDDLVFGFPSEAWEQMRTNLGYWWFVYAISAEERPAILRSREIRCLIRHEPVARVVGSTIAYPDQGHLPVVDLGGAKQPGWIEPGDIPARPALGERKLTVPARRDRRRKPAPAQETLAE
jgi:radical SAM protein with 4Fe4S-binding SPASM domain